MVSPVIRRRGLALLLRKKAKRKAAAAAAKRAPVLVEEVQPEAPKKTAKRAVAPPVLTPVEDLVEEED
tara:strand:- start:1284 stop:1487 length:204 start_codon:yes stop_codon:yes gene_type:complete